MLYIRGEHNHLDWLATQDTLEGLVKLLTTLQQELHMIMYEILSLFLYEGDEGTCGFGSRVSDVANKFNCHIILNIKTPCISVEKDVGDIDVPNLSAIRLELYQRTFE